MNDKIVSVVMCTYNGSRFVAEQIESICKQTYRHIQVVVVDDASSDNTFEIVQHYAASDNRIQCLRNDKNLGFNLNFSKACQLANGEFIAIADQDDIWEPTKIEKLLTKINENENTMLVHAISARFDPSGKYHLKSHRLVNYQAGNDVRNFFLSNYISGHNMLFRQSLLEKSLPFPRSVYYDWWLAAVASCNGRIEPVPEILVWHRMHDANATGAAKPKVPLYKQVMITLPQLLTIPGMKETDHEFGVALLKYYSLYPSTTFSWTLFFFLLRKAKIIFAHKKRSFPWISYVKHAFKAARASTKA